MNDQKQTICDCVNETDRMINEGLGSGSINPKYAEVHAELKEKQELLSLSKKKTGDSI
ncbi:hypothetical protein QOZ98_000041 [Planomicrobium stackebrandtii]|uniref:Uncharacterized protein n=1 Tax=Planomicrobium stackebrandtii TaxID=253160 RepID=A0ABU0GPD4_9BACL|nr:hypothetical protein [Planomicrobium stackebrandtii]MDQ0427216.1 hypothetical protein [Planomicrobium stackebrandtii]